ncbi:MAG TPA: preprotein translocase subunit YajC [Streptosporangiaceae bacterium]|jgi:preprotein translocase subunit YajC|nr:preprotein translocase subunit YajC [Streptosporangiaceae bacterium]
MGTHFLAAAEATTKSSSSTSLLLIVVVFAVLMIFMFRSQRRRQRATQETQRQVANGSKVRTVTGMFGKVVDGDDRNVMVEIAPGVTVKMLRQAIAVVLPDDEPDGVAPSMPDFEHTGPDLDGDQSPAQPENRSDATI